MGKAIEQEAIARDHHISFAIDRHNQEELQLLSQENTDVVIEFTHPDSFSDNLTAVLDAGIPMVSGTTGWYEQIAFFEDLVAEKEGTFLYASNFSIGVNILFRLNQQLAALMNRHEQYDCFIEERHHRHKADSPSGTAYTLALQVLEELDRKKAMASDELRKRAPREDELSVGYVRSGEIIGTHRVSYTSEIDSISIQHRAHNRRGFALGAVIGAEWLIGKKGWFSFADVI